MLHVLNIIVVAVVLPVLAASMPHSSRWKEMYDRLHADYPARQNVMEHRGVPLRRVLDELSRLEQQQQQQREVADLQAENGAPSGLLLPSQDDAPRALLPPGTDTLRGEEGDVYRGRMQLDQLARLKMQIDRAMKMFRSNKRGSGFVGAPGSAGGPNMYGR